MTNASRPPVGTVAVGLRHDGRDRPYLLRLPAADHPVALVVELHGRGIDPILFDRWTGYSALADAEGFALALPSAIGEIWNDGRFGGPAWRGHEDIDDVGYLLALIDDVIARHPIDPLRVYVVGMSNGGAMAGRLAWEHPERLSAIAQVAGTAAVAVAAEPARGTPRPLPVLEIHGTADRVARYDGGRPGRWMRLLMQRPASPALGVDAWARRWVERNGAADAPEVENVAPDVTVRRWRGSSSASDVVFYRVEGGGHTWPGARLWMPPHLGRVSRSIDATRVTWDFLAAHRREA